MDKQQWQQQLPEGLQLGRELSGAVLFGTAFEAEDHRFPGSQPIRRFVHCLEVNGSDGWETNWKQQLAERLHKLADVSSPHIARPLEARFLNDQRAVYLVDDRSEFRLSVPRSGLDPAIAAALFGQVVDGLIDLHKGGICHGDLRSRNLYADEAKPTETTDCRLTNAATGPLMYWSRGRLADEDASHYYPPEWAGNAREPSIESDLYALGVLGCELFLGPGRRTADEARQELKLKENKIPRPIRNTLTSLLHHRKQKRPSTVRDVRERLNPSPWKHLASIAIVLLVVAMLGLVIFAENRRQGSLVKLHAAQSENEKLKTDLTTAKDELKKAKQSLKLVRDERDGLKDEVAKLKGQIKRINTVLASAKSDKEKISLIRKILGPVRHPERKVWEDIAREALAGTDAGTVPLDLSQRLMDAIKKRKPDKPDIQKRLKKFARDLRPLTDSPGAGPWVTADTSDRVVRDYRDLVRVAVHQPWGSKLTEAREQLAALRTAAEIWNRYATEQDLSWDDFKAKTDDAAVGKPNEERVQKIFREWQAAFNTHKGKWTLQLISGEAKTEDYGTGRLVTIYVNGSNVANTKYHEWMKATAHDYTQDENHGTLEFSWEPGQSIGLLLEGERSVVLGGARENLIDVTSDTDKYGGPVAVWWLQLLPRIHANGVVLEWRIKDCPGPPPDVY